MIHEATLKRWTAQSSDRQSLMVVLSVAAVLVLLPALGLNNYLLHICVLVFVYLSLGLGLNVVVGFAGLLDLGYVAFYAVGAYTYALLSVHFQVPFLPAFLAGASLAAAFGIVMGWPTIRTRGDYLALVTLGFGEIVRLVLRNWDAVTNGPKGIMDLPSPSIAGITFSTPTHYYYLGLLLAALTLALSWRLKSSAVGSQLVAIRDDEDAAVAVGINPVRWKLYAFAVGAFVAGMAGVFFASWQRFVSPESFTLGESILILSIVVLGGMGRLLPVIAAAAFLVLLPEALRGLDTYRILVLGVTLVIVVILQERLRLLKTRNQTASLAGVRRESMTPLPDLRDPESVGPLEPGAETILSLCDVSKSFGGVRALNGVSLDIWRGEVLGLVGANGAGKTTLFNCIAGALNPDGGEIKLATGGRSVALNHLPPFQIARLGLARTFQQPRLFSSLSAGENVQLGVRCKDVPKLWAPLWRGSSAAITAEAQRHLQAVCGPAPEEKADGMSFVDRKLTELARALAASPKVLLVDEPASGMEPTARERLAKLLRRVSEEKGVTVIVVEHDLVLLSSICHRLVVLERGRVIAVGRPGDEYVSEMIRRTYHASGGEGNAARSA